MKKLTTILLIISILTLSLSCLVTYADGTGILQLEAELISGGKLISATTNMPSTVRTAAVRKTLYDVILDGLSQMDAKIYVGDFGLSLENDNDRIDVIDTYNSVVNSTPCLFYIYEQFSVEYDLSDGHVQYIVPTYMENVSYHKEIFQRKTVEILSRIIRPGMSDEAKTMAVHDYLVRHAEYNYGEQTMDDHTAYGVIVKGLGVCQSYALAYNYLLTLVGVETKFCASEYLYDSSGNIVGGMNHGWSVVKLNGNWYHVDLTWDDPNYGSESENSKGYVIHDYYLYSDETFLESKAHKDWVVDVQCTDKSYETGMPFHIDEERRVSIPDGVSFEGYFPMYQFKYNENDGLFYSQVEPAKLNVYFKTNFDGSVFEFITEAEYDAAVTPPDGLFIYDAIDIVNHRMAYSDVDNLTNSFVAFENTTEDDHSGTMIIALYNDKNDLVSCKMQSITIPAKQVFGVKISPVEGDNATKGKIFVWNESTLTEVTTNYIEF